MARKNATPELDFEAENRRFRQKNGLTGFKICHFFGKHFLHPPTFKVVVKVVVKVLVKVLVKKCDAFSRTTFFCIKRQEFFSTKKVLHSMHFSMHFFDAFLDLGTIFSMKLVFFFVVCFRSLEKSIRPRLQTPSERKPDMVYDSFSVLKRPIPFFGRN